MTLKNAKRDRFLRGIRAAQIARGKRDLLVPGGLSLHLRWVVENLMEEAEGPEPLDRGTFYAVMRDLPEIAEQLRVLETHTHWARWQNHAN